MKKQIGILIFPLFSLIAQAQTPGNFKHFIEAEAQKNNELVRQQSIDEALITPNQLMYDVHFYSLDFEIFSELKKIHGTVTIHAEALAPLALMELNFEGNNEVHGVYLAEHPDSALDFQHMSSRINIQLDRSYIEGEVIKVLVEFTTPSTLKFEKYQGSDMIYSWLGISRVWFPCKQMPADKVDSTDVRVTVPGNLVVASNGLLKEVSYTDTTSTYFWQERYPIAPYVIFFAAHPYEIHTDWYVNQDNDSLEIQMFTIPSVYEGTKDSYKKEKEMLAFYEERFGPYPFVNEKYGHAEVSNFSSAMFQTMTGLSIDNVQREDWGEWTIAHELSHSWMGNSVSLESWNHVWIIEGFATYATSIWYDFNKIDGWDLESLLITGEYYGPGTIYVEDPVTQDIFDDNLTYFKAAWVYHMLRHIVGDSLFFSTIKEIASDSVCAYGNIDTNRFREISELVSGINLDKFFQQWIYGEYYPDYVYSWTYSQKETGYELELTLNQVQEWQLFWMPVDVAVQTASGIEKFVVWDSLETQVFHLAVNDLPQSVELDPDNGVLNKASDITGEHSIPKEIFNIYPNPTYTLLTIETVNSGILNIEITSLNGQLIYDEIMEGTTHQLDLSSFQKGVYFITISSKDFISTRKIVKL